MFPVQESLLEKLWCKYFLGDHDDTRDLKQKLKKRSKETMKITQILGSEGALRYVYGL